MELILSGVRFSYNAVNEVLRGISFEVSSGKVLGIIGPNGSGKTTLLQCINNVLKPMKGTVCLDGREVNTLNRREIAREIGFLAQRETAGFPFTVYEVILMGRYSHLRFLAQPGERDYQIVDKLIETLGIGSLKERRIDEISGGEFQKVIIGRVLAQEPQILLFDEPTLHLDIQHQIEILDLARNIVCEKKLILIMVTHDLFLAGRYCQEILLMHRGKVHDIGGASRVLSAANIRDVYGIDVEIVQDSVTGRPVVIPLDKACSH